MRLDKWLWFSRFYKSRAQASALCMEGQITLNGQPADKDHKIKPGDRIGLPGSRGRRMVTVAAFGERRGPPSEAHALYIEDSPFQDDQQEDEEMQ